MFYVHNDEYADMRYGINVLWKEGRKMELVLRTPWRSAYVTLRPLKAGLCCTRAQEYSMEATPAIARTAPPRCSVCFSAWGQCTHTGGPWGEAYTVRLPDRELDPRAM